MPIHPDRILFQDQWLLAVHKLTGELTVAGKGEVKKLSLFDFLRPEFPGIHPLNRLDFETSGIVLFAKSKKVLADVVDGGFKGWTKTYQTLVTGVLKRDSGDIRLALPSRAKGESVEAHTKFKVLERFAFATYVEAEIASGKHHQIRRHFSMTGNPLALDREYGDKKFNNGFSQKYKYYHFFLHASAVRFPHPVTGDTVVIKDPPPDSFMAMLKKLRSTAKAGSAVRTRFAVRQAHRDTLR